VQISGHSGPATGRLASHSMGRTSGSSTLPATACPSYEPARPRRASLWNQPWEARGHAWMLRNTSCEPPDFRMALCLLPGGWPEAEDHSFPLVAATLATLGFVARARATGGNTGRAARRRRNVGERGATVGGFGCAAKLSLYRFSAGRDARWAKWALWSRDVVTRWSPGPVPRAPDVSRAVWALGLRGMALSGDVRLRNLPGTGGIILRRFVGGARSYERDLGRPLLMARGFRTNKRGGGRGPLIVRSDSGYPQLVPPILLITAWSTGCKRAFS